MRLSDARRVVHLALDDLVSGGELLYAEQEFVRVGKVHFRIAWPAAGSLRFLLDSDASELSFPSLVSKVDVNSPWYKSLQPRLRRGFGPDTTVFLRRSVLAVRMTVHDGAFTQCTSSIIRIAKSLVAEVVETVDWRLFQETRVESV